MPSSTNSATLPLPGDRRGRRGRACQGVATTLFRASSTLATLRGSLGRWYGKLLGSSEKKELRSLSELPYTSVQTIPRLFSGIRTDQPRPKTHVFAETSHVGYVASLLKMRK